MIGSTADVFVSYKAEDRARLRPLVAALEAEGFSVWWDAHIGGGTDWREDIQNHLDDAKCVIVAWSKRSTGPEGRFVRDEASRAMERGVYLPVKIEDVRPPLGFGETQALSLGGWKGNRKDPRFQAVADAVRSRISGEHQPHRPSHFVEGRVSRRAVMAGGAGAVAVAGAGGWFLLKPTAANAKRIAVLPFANLSGDEKQAYFCDGVAEELRAALSRIQFEVIGRTSCEAVKGLDAKAAASKLGVANILTGSVRRSPEQIRINAQLVSGSDGVERWAQTYDRVPGDAIKIQSDIAINVAQALSVALGQAKRAALKLGGTADSAALDLRLQAKQLLGAGREPLRKAIELLDAALARDPNYADAYVAKANVLSELGGYYPSGSEDMAKQYALAEVAARRALAIAPNLGSAHAALAFMYVTRMMYHKTLEHARQALALSPEDPNVLASALSFLPYIGDQDNALRLANRLVALDPVNRLSYRTKSEALLSMRLYREAVETGRQGLKIASEWAGLHLFIGLGFILLNDFPAATAQFRSMPSDDRFRLTGEALVSARSGNVAAAEGTMRRIRQLAGDAFSYQYAQIHAQGRDKDRAFADLEKTLEAKDPGIMYAKTDPFLDPIRGDPRYIALIRRLKFP